MLDYSLVIDLLAGFVELMMMFFVLGYLTPKFIAYSIFATSAMVLLSYIAPYLTPHQVWSTAIPLIIDMTQIYPWILTQMVTLGGSEYGAMGVAIYGGMVIVLLPMYLVGIYLGIITWPFLLLLRLIL